jgi:hypothetical protein
MFREVNRSRCLDIDNILWEEEKVSGTFNLDCNQIGFLDPNHHGAGGRGAGPSSSDKYFGGDDDDTSAYSMLPMGSRIALPLWLAIVLADKNFIEIEVPKHLGPKMRQAIDAGAGSVNIREFSYYFFETGMELSRYLGNTRSSSDAANFRRKEADNIASSLRKAFFGDRYEKLFTYALTGGHHDTTEFIQTLTAAEQTVFQKGHNAYRAYNEWKASATVLLKASAAVMSSNKRGRDSRGSADGHSNSSDKRSKAP